MNEIGLDSLRSVTLANRLEDEFGILISISELISGPTINQLVDHLSELIAPEQVPGPDLTVPEAVIGALAESQPIGVGHANLRAMPAVQGIPRSLTAEVRGVSGQSFDSADPQKITNGYELEEAATESAENGNGLQDHADFAMNERVLPSGNGAGTAKFGTAMLRPAPDAVSHTTGKWLIAPRHNPSAKARLFCFPYAGGGLVSFRAWARVFDPAVEVVAVEAPGRGTRINETAIGDLGSFVEGLLPEIVDWMDRPSAFFGHCLGGLTMFATLCALPEERAHFIKRVFACGVRPPHLLKRRGEFEDNLAYDMMLNRKFDVDLPPYAQADEIFADIIRQFGIPAANKMLEIPTLRKALLPTIRAEFGMAYNYEFQPVELFSFPISSFVGNSDPWVSEEDSAGWGKLTRGGFNNHVCKGSHFLMADDEDYILETINNEFVNSVIQ